ncbi:acetylglutamate kinase [Olsenella sp. AF16-14LB]|jgi:acetylglutamate kinase|uniref:acetylglutamate kinase n=1 Tax=Atopobiaceae TaxID=1643824 RepID=UPI000690A4C7|nr:MULTISPECIES: acetylglutamate kinase [unclassified Olsenella]RGJ47833.1 acetylglutamate kinase [Olsenella sp. TM06-36]RGS50717.1 acetylglutamate kinase [Olsenella sp. AF21-51]RGU50519.1 acetylglutamate kinase [Olsenella sp. AF16-14LB]RGU81976.1 acetylglutamate kinase [Olsenella sp. AF15-43LB]RHD76003.1 acetylglutamate kinase [Olsenella sp. AM30-3LB]
MQGREEGELELAQRKAEVLTEALPWINKMRGKTVVVKYGGSAMEDPKLMVQVLGDIELLKLMGMRVVLVHGGGKAISAMLTRLNMPVQFKNGLRVTDDDTMEAVQEVLIGKVNQQLVWALNEYGHNAVGISGADGKTLKAVPVSPELGRVGHIREVSPELIETILDDDYIPVIASVACGPDGFFNVNADEAASAVAEALHADKLIYLTDVDGLFADVNDKGSLIRSLTKAETKSILASGELAGGMVPKVRSIVEAMDRGVSEVVILNGKSPHSLLLEIFTDAGVGTLFTQE